MTRGSDFEDIPKVCPNVEIIRHELLKATVVGMEIVARIWTSHTRPTQSHVEEVFGTTETRGRGVDKRVRRERNRREKKRKETRERGRGRKGLPCT